MAKETSTKAKGPVNKSGGVTAKKKPDEYLEVKAEEVHEVIQLSAPVAVGKIINPEEQAKIEVAKFDVARSWIAEKKKEFSDLKVTGVDDKEGLKKITEAWREIKEKRFAVRDRHEELKAGYLIVSRAIDKEKNELTTLLEEIEKPLKAQIDRIELEKKEAAQAKEREAQEKLHSRIVQLIDNGIKLADGFYSIGETIAVGVDTIRNFTDADYDVFLGKVRKENEAIQAAEEKRKADEQAERDNQERIRKDNERKAEELKAEQQRIKDERIQSRGEFLENLGLTLNEKNGSYEYVADGKSFFSIELYELAECTAEEWTNYKDAARRDIKAANDAIERALKEKAEKEEADKLLSVRRTTLEQIGVVFAQNTGFFRVALDTEKIEVCELSELKTISDEEFTNLTKSTHKIIDEEKEKYNKKKADEAAQAALAAVHKNDMVHLGFTEYGNLYRRVSAYDPSRAWHIHKEQVENSTVDEWGIVLEGARVFAEEVEKFDAEEKKKADDKKEADRQAALSDGARVTEWLKKLDQLMTDVPVPADENSPLVDILGRMDEQMTVLMAELEETIKEL